jgi:uncharacterized protein (TIGR00290 family)
VSREPVIISWSGGKDSMLALHDIRSSGDFEVVAALTTMSKDYDRICMHGVRRSLLHRQAAALDLPLEEIVLPQQPTNAEYEAGLNAALESYKAKGVRRIIFGDIFLADLKEYRDKNLAKLGMAGIYPLWLKDSRAIVQRFLTLGYATLLVCVDTKVLSGDFAGRALDDALLKDLPSTVDPCGENGEFHTFVWKGPLFREPLALRLGEKVLRDQFMYCDLIEEPTETFTQVPAAEGALLC